MKPLFLWKYMFFYNTFMGIVAIYWVLFIWTKKICQRIPPGVLNIFLILWTTTNHAQMKVFFIAHCQPGGAVIIFPKSARNQNWTPLFSIKKLPLPLLSVSEILFGRTVMELWIFCRQRPKNKNWLFLSFFTQFHPI